MYHRGITQTPRKTVAEPEELKQQVREERGEGGGLCMAANTSLLS